MLDTPILSHRNTVLNINIAKGSFKKEQPEVLCSLVLHFFLSSTQDEISNSRNSLTPMMLICKSHPAPAMIAVQSYRVFAHPVNYLSLRPNVYLNSKYRPWAIINLQ